MNQKVLLINENNKNYDGVLFQAPFVVGFGDFIATKNEICDKIIINCIEDENNIDKYKELIENTKIENDKTLVLLAPNFATDGHMNENSTKLTIEKYKSLIQLSDVFAPNLTEACFLTDIDYFDITNQLMEFKFQEGKEYVEQLSKKLLAIVSPLLDKLKFKGTQITILTGLRLQNSIFNIVDVFNGDTDQRSTTCNYVSNLDSYDGMREIKNVLFFELASNGASIEEAISTTVAFIDVCIKFTKNVVKDAKRLMYEPIFMNNITHMLGELSKKNQHKEGEK